MINEDLAFRQSVIHCIDPAVRIVCAVIFSFAAALSQSFEVLGAFAAIALILVAAASLTIRETARRLRPLMGFLLMIWVLLPLTYEGDVIITVGPLSLTRPGVLLCAAISLKSVTVLLFFMALLATMTVATMGQALHRLRIPDKFIFLLLMTYRYISVIEEEYARLLRAAKFRGFRPGTNLHSYRTYAYLAGMLFVRASCRAQRVHQAMLCRGFHGRFHTLVRYSPTAMNACFLAGTGLITLGLAVMEIFYT